MGIRSQILIGIDTSVTLHSNGIEEPYWMQRPLFSPLYHMSNQTLSSQKHFGKTENARGLIEAAQTVEEASEVIIDGLQAKLSRTLAVEKGNIDTTRPMHTYGVDSLSAVELRNWFRTAVGVDVAGFDILGNQSLAELAATVAPRSQFLSEDVMKSKEQS